MTSGKISNLINPINKYGRMARVHSVFENSFNIRVGKQLINIGAYNDYLSSFGLNISRLDYERVRGILAKDLLVKLEERALVVYGRTESVRITWEKNELMDLRIYPIESGKKEGDLLFEILDEMDLVHRIGFSVDRGESEIFSSLAEGHTIKKQDEWDKIVDFLLGRGKGLTPSGDDILVGYLFILILYKNEEAEGLIKALSKIRGKTTDISYEYIKGLIKGYVSSPIYDLYTALKTRCDKSIIKKKVERIIQIGHTSGKDISFGMYLALKNAKKDLREN